LGFEPGRVVEREPYDLLFGERKAPDGTALGRPPGSGRKAADIYARLLAAEPHATAERKRELRLEATRQARQSPLFFDLTLSLSKSISIFHASLGENARLARQAGDAAGDRYWSGLVGEMDAMIWDAVRAGFGYFQREAGYTRTGSHNKRVHGQETGQWHEADLAVAHWLQHTSRDGDMQLHFHSQIAHVARTQTDGKWRAPDSLGYNEHIGAVAAIVAQHVEGALTRRFGLEWVAHDDGHGFEIKGISGQMMRLFSSRRNSITTGLRERAARFEQRYGRKPSQRELAQLAQASNFATRKGKDGALDFAQLDAGWADKLARTLGVPLASVAPKMSIPIVSGNAASPPSSVALDFSPNSSRTPVTQFTVSFAATSGGGSDQPGGHIVPARTAARKVADSPEVQQAASYAKAAGGKVADRAGAAEAKVGRAIHDRVPACGSGRPTAARPTGKGNYAQTPGTADGPPGD
jgi:hypothetical protein